MRHTAVLLILAASVLIGRSAGAQALPESLVACARQADPAQRLHCYDTQMAGLGVLVAAPAPAAPPAAVPVPAPVAAPPAPAPASPAAAPAAVAAAASPPTPVAKFGSEDLKQSVRPKEAKADKVMESVITSIHEARPKLFIIVLANGQIWMQEGTQITSFFRAGYNAHIEKGLLGDYRMSTHETGDKNMVRVTRIQ